MVTGTIWDECGIDMQIKLSPGSLSHKHRPCLSPEVCARTCATFPSPCASPAPVRGKASAQQCLLCGRGAAAKCPVVKGSVKEEQEGSGRCPF